MSIQEIESKVWELRQLQALIEEAKEETDAIRDAIKSQMGDTEELRAGEYKITWRSITSTKLDSTAFQEALPDVAQRFTKTTTYRRFTIA